MDDSKSLNDFKQNIKKHFKCSFIEIYLDNKFSSHCENYRQHIREHIVENHKNDLSMVEQNTILNLDKLPCSKNLYFSISHCPEMGGYAVCNQPVGFDLEVTSRINPQLIRRICTNQEIDQAPHIELLWVAKESVLKLSSKNTLTSNIVIDNWIDGFIFSNKNFNGLTTQVINPLSISVAFNRV